MTSPVAHLRSTALRSWEVGLTLALLWAAGVALRITILALPPALPAIVAELGLSAIDVGVLAGLPPLLFAAVALPAAGFVLRFGPVPTLILGLLLNAVGAAMRGFAHGALDLEAATAAMCLGVAVMQPVLPVLVRAWAPTRVGFATAVYTNGLLVGEVIPIVLAPGLELPLVGGSWRAALAVWALPIVATAACFALSGRCSVPSPGAARARLSWRDGRVWRAGFLLGGVNASYFGLNGFLPGWFAAAGRPDLVQPALIALNLAQIPASLLMLTLADCLVRRRSAYGVGGAAYVAGVVGVILAPGPAAVAAAALAGFANAALLTLALAVPSVLGEAEEVPRISAAMFTIGYGFAVVMAVLAGRLWDASGIAVLAVLPFAFTAALTGLLGLTLRQPVTKLPRSA